MTILKPIGPLKSMIMSKMQQRSVESLQGFWTGAQSILTRTFKERTRLPEQKTPRGVPVDPLVEVKNLISSINYLSGYETMERELQ